MNVLTLLNEKGGVGKTTMAVHIAAGLAIRGQRVLLIDADAQANATLLLDNKEYGGLYRLLIQDEGWAGVLNAPAAATWHGGYTNTGELALLPSNVETRGIPMMTDDHNLLADRLAEIEEMFDVCVIDTSPTPSMLHAMIYHATTHVILPTQCDMLALSGVGKSVQRIVAASKLRVNQGKAPIQLMGIQPTMTSNTNAHQFGLESLQKHFGAAAVWQPIRALTVWRDAAYDRRTLFAYAPEHDATEETWSMIDRVMTNMSHPVNA